MAIEVRSGVVPQPDHPCWKTYMKYDRPNVFIHGVWTQIAAQSEFLRRYYELTA
jgi:hypothetical protein